MRRTGGSIFIFVCIFLTSFPLNSINANIKSNSNLSCEDLQKVIVTEIFRKLNVLSINFDLEEIENLNIKFDNKESDFLGFPSPLTYESSDPPGIDSSLKNYLALQQMGLHTNGGNSSYKVVIFDHLVDAHHTDLSNAITKAVLLPNNHIDPIVELDQAQLAAINLYEDSLTKDYILSSEEPGYFGHGTAIAGVIHQIAPNVDIISVAIRRDISFNQLKPSIERFLSWLELFHDEKFIINISSGWSEALTANDMDSSISGSIANRTLNLVYDGSKKKHLFVCSAGNDNSIEVMFPANLANDMDSESWADEILGKLDLNDNPAKANGIISVGAIYDEGSSVGRRKSTYAYDYDSDGDMELMAPGFNIETTYQTYNPYSDDLYYISFSGTSASAPVVCGLAALICGESSTSLSAVELEKVITENAIYDQNCDAFGDNRLKKYGHGMLNFIETLAEYETSLENLDSDGDTLLDVDELYYYHIDPLKTDTDDDGLPDNWELDHGKDPAVSNGIDSDGDTLINSEELLHGTDPFDSDTDDDFLTDYQEIMLEGTDPFDSDTDNDGYADGYECDAQRNWDPLNPFDPNSQPENVEVIQQSDATQLYISWDEMSGITLYRVEYKANGDPNWISVNTTNSFLLLTSLEEGTEYLFLVYALSNYNNCWSGGNYEFGWTRQPQPDITILTLSDYVDITIEYYLSDSATELELWWRKDGEDWVLYGTYESSSSVTIEDLDIDTWYYFKTRQRVAGAAYEDEYWSVYSYETSIQTIHEPTPLNVRYFNGNPGTIRITFTWTKPTNWESGWTYYVWRKPESGGSYTLIKVTEGHSFNHYPPNPNTMYTYRITCYNNDGVHGPYSYWTGKAGGGGGGPM